MKEREGLIWATVCARERACASGLPTPEQQTPARSQADRANRFPTASRRAGAAVPPCGSSRPRREGTVQKRHAPAVREIPTAEDEARQPSSRAEPAGRPCGERNGAGRLQVKPSARPPSLPGPGPTLPPACSQPRVRASGGGGGGRRWARACVSAWGRARCGRPRWPPRLLWRAGESGARDRDRAPIPTLPPPPPFSSRPRPTVGSASCPGGEREGIAAAVRGAPAGGPCRDTGTEPWC